MGKPIGSPVVASSNSTLLASNRTTGVEQFSLDLWANVQGDVNSLLFVPIFLLLSWWLASELMGRSSSVSRLLKLCGCLKREQRGSQRHDASVMVTEGQNEPWICGPSTICHMFSDIEVMDKTKEELSNKYNHVGLVSTLLLGIVSKKWGEAGDDYPMLDKHVYGILWCAATYAFFCSTVSTVMIIFGYGQCYNDAEARFWTRHMGKFALRLPMLSAGIGFVLYIMATSHFYIMVFRRGKGDDFAVCAAFCYAALPITVFALLKVHHGLQATRKRQTAMNALLPLEYEDIDALFKEYIGFDHCKNQSHLDADFDGFIEFATGRKIVRDGLERGGRLRGLRRAYAETLVKSFHDVEMAFQKPLATERAERIFADLAGTQTGTGSRSIGFGLCSLEPGTASLNAFASLNPHRAMSPCSLV